MSDVTQILSRIEAGDQQASADLLPLVYDELRKLATARMASERADHTLQATALVHEAYLRLVKAKDEHGWDSRGHFFAAAAESMRRILVERARQKRSLKRGGGMARHDFADVEVAGPAPSVDLLALNEALEKLEQRDKVKADLVKLRYFAGLTIAQAARSLGIAHSTADKYWAYAKCWLRMEMAGSPTDETAGP